MNWELFSFIGTIAFAISGAIIAMEEKYDIVGVFVLGLVTAFGGGVVRNILIGIPVPTLWEQDFLLSSAIVVILITFIVPSYVFRWWTSTGSFFDAIGLAAFAVQGGMYAKEMGHPMSAVVVAAVLTGIGGGIIRDVLAKRKPVVLRDEIYAGWAILAGAIIGLGWAKTPIELAVLFAAVVALRMMSVYWKWKLPRRRLPAKTAKTKKPAPSIVDLDR